MANITSGLKVERAGHTRQINILRSRERARVHLIIEDMTSRGHSDCNLHKAKIK